MRTLYLSLPYFLGILLLLPSFDRVESTISLLRTTTGTTVNDFKTIANINYTCYGAYTPLFTWCSGYEKAGYNCSGDYCASSSCVGDCFDCSVAYTNSVLDPSTGRCCDANPTMDLTTTSTGCSNPRPAQPPYVPLYGYPDHRPALIVEGPANYTNGPPVWSNATEEAAYAFTMYAESGVAKDDLCTPLPSNTSFDINKIKPISLKQHHVAIDVCVLSCNITEVRMTGYDPCGVGTVNFTSNDGPVYAPMRCYWGGESWLTPSWMGICGYNCTARNPSNGAWCNQTEIDNDICELYCDPRYTPTS